MTIPLQKQVKMDKIGGGYLTALVESRFFQWLFVLSCTLTSLSFSKPSVIALIGYVLAFAVAYYLTFHKNILKHTFSPFSPTVFSIALVLAFVAIGFNVPGLLQNYSSFPYRVQTKIGIPQPLQTSLTYTGFYLLYLKNVPLFFAFFYAFIIRFGNFIRELYQTCDKIERCFFTTVMVLGIIALTVIYNQTNCFYAPVDATTGKTIRWDAVYTFDSTLYYNSAYYCPGIIHKVLQYIFSLPLVATAYCCSVMLFFIPHAYPIVLGVLQVMLMCCTLLLLSRLLHLQGLNKIVFLIFFAVTYFILVNALTFDGYVFNTFWLICLLYILDRKRTTDEVYAYIAATGSLLTTGILILLFILKKEFKKSVIYVMRVLLTFSVFVLFFNFRAVRSLFERNLLEYYSEMSGVSLSFTDKFLQYLNFIASCFIKPETIIAPLHIEGVGTWQNYQLAPVESLNILGLLFLFIALLGFILNYKDKFAQICAFWIAFSFFVLCLVGWGTAENGLILYSLYFGWAYFCLIFLAIETLLQKLPAVKYTVYAACIAALAYINIPAMYDLIQFGVKYYPCL